MKISPIRREEEDLIKISRGREAFLSGIKEALGYLDRPSCYSAPNTTDYVASSPCNERDLTLMQVLLSSPREKLAFGHKVGCTPGLFIYHRCFSFSFFLFALVRIRKTRF